MDQGMSEEIKQEWESSLEMLMNLPAGKRRHFALLLISLAKCYADKDGWQAVVIINNDDALLTFSAGATESEAATLLKQASEAVFEAATADAPPREMFN